MASPVASKIASSSDQSLAIIAPSTLRNLTPIGQGFFGTVYRAMFRHAPVAVKKLKGNADPASIEKERRMFSSIPPHPNVLRVIAICVDPDDGSLSIVTEYYATGSVRSFLASVPQVGLPYQMDHWCSVSALLGPFMICDVCAVCCDWSA